MSQLKIKYLLKNILKPMLRPLMNKYYSGIATIFMLHRVHPFEDNKLLPNEELKISPEFLDKFILDLKSKGYTFISLDRLYEILQNNEKAKKQIVFTFDDGYKDNYEIAYPIFKKYNIPFTIYVTTAFPEHKAIMWWYILEDLIIKNEEIMLSNNMHFKCATMDEKVKTFLGIKEIIIALDQKNILEGLNRLFEGYQIDWLSKSNKLSMSWEQIIKLSKDPLVTIAGHTKNHLALNRLTESEIIDEIIEANKLIEENTGIKIEHFAYPFGSQSEIGEKEFKIVERLGFKTATTTRGGNIFYKHENHLECLPRFMLTENYDIQDLGHRRKPRIVTK